MAHRLAHHHLNANAMLFTDLLPTMALVVSASVILVAGLFTVRTNIAATWKENYNAEAERRKLAEQELEEQREAKHKVLNELAAARLRTDITQLIKLAEEIREEMNRERNELEGRLRAEHADLVKMLEKILTRMEEG